MDMNEQENNKLIAEFMGLSIKEGVCYYTDEDDMFPMGIEVEEPYLPYDDSWDWLMDVVDKIEEIEYVKGIYIVFSYTFQIENKSVTIWKHSDRFDSKRIIEINGNTKREATYNAVVEFIKQLNK